MREPRGSRRGAAAVLLLLAVAGPAASAAAPVPGVHALTGARLVLGPGRVLAAGTLVIRDGIIEAVGADVEAPPDARIWELAGLTVYPGLIEPCWERPGPGEGEEKTAAAGHPNPHVRPEREALAGAVETEAIDQLRRGGFTTALAVPAEGIFRGRSALLNLGDGALSENLLAPRFAHHAALEASGYGGDYPSSLMGAAALFRQVLLDSRWHEAAQAAYRADPAQERPETRLAWSLLAPPAAGEELMILDTGDVLGTLRLAGLAEELGLRAYLVGNGEEYRWLEAVAATGLPHILPLTFPEVPEVGEEDDLSVGLAELRHWERAPENPGSLLEAGVTVAFTGRGLETPAKIHPAVAKATARGLSAEQALAALTVTPAGLLGLGDRAGTLDAGKMANLAVARGDLFVDEPELVEVWIDGVRYPFEDEEDGEGEEDAGRRGEEER